MFPVFKKNIFLSIVSCTAIWGHAQQCGLAPYNAFVLNIKAMETGAKIKGLKIYLVDEQNKSMMANNNYTDRRGNLDKSKQLTSPIMFWDNSEPNLKATSHTPARNIHLKGAEKNYVCLIYRPTIDYEKFEQINYPTYKAMIVDEDGEKNGGYFDTVYVLLNYERTVNVCRTNFQDRILTTKQDYTNYCEDGHLYKPATIFLTPLSKNKIKHEPAVRDIWLKKHNDNASSIATVDEVHLRKISYKIIWDTIKNSQQEDSVYGIKQIVIQQYPVQTVLQKIDVTKPFYTSSFFLKKLIEFGDFYKDNSNEVNDFRILSATTFDERTGFTCNRHLHYTYNSNVQKFELDTLLSNYCNVSIGNTIERKTVEQTKESRVSKTYTLKNRNWVVTGRNEISLRPTDPKKQRITEPKPFRWIGEKYIEKGLLFTNKEGQTFIRHTFRFVNMSYDTIILKSLKDTYKCFTLNTYELLPLDTCVIFYEEAFQNFTNNFQFINREVSLVPQGKDFGESIAISFIIAHNHVEILKDATSPCQYIANDAGNKLVEWRLHFNQERKLVEYGLMNVQTKKKQGMWLYKNHEIPTAHADFHSKKIIVYYDYEKWEWPKIFLKSKTGNWDTTQYWATREGVHFFVTENTDSVLLKVDSTYASFGLNYKSLGPEQAIKVTFINPKDSYFYHGMGIYKAKMVYTLIDAAYAIGLAPGVNTRGNHDSLFNSILIGLMKDFPGIISLNGFDRRRGGQWEIHFPASYPNKEKTLKAISQKPFIRFLSQKILVHKSFELYILPQVQVTFNNARPIEEVKKTLRLYNLNYTGVCYDAANTYYGMYRSKVLDAAFYKNYNALIKDANIENCSLDYPIYAEPDHLDKR